MMMMLFNGTDNHEKETTIASKVVCSCSTSLTQLVGKVFNKRICH